MATAADVRMSAYELLDELANGDGGAWLHVEADSITSFWVEANNGFPPDEILSLALDGYQVDDPPGWDRVPSMYRAPSTVGQAADRKMYEGRREPVGWYTAEDAKPLECGDLVSWGTGSRGRIINTYATGIASVAIDGWWFNKDLNCYTRRDTGTPGCLRIALSDLTPIRGEG